MEISYQRLGVGEFGVARLIFEIEVQGNAESVHRGWICVSILRDISCTMARLASGGGILVETLQQRHGIRTQRAENRNRRRLSGLYYSPKS